MVPIIYNEEADRWIRGDRYVRPAVRRLFRGAPDRRSGMQKVVDNFIKGLKQLDIEYRLNPSRRALRNAEKVISFGLGLRGLEGVDPHTAVIATVGFPHPLELPSLCVDYRIAKFLQHSDWVLNLAKAANVYDEKIFGLWNAGVDTEEWIPARGDKRYDILLYDKIQWDREVWQRELAIPLRSFLSNRRLKVREVQYGGYNNAEFKGLLDECRAMIFLSPHESQGLAYQECLSCDVPVFAWNPGYWMDPARLKYGQNVVPACSVPFFDSQCGATFADFREFERDFEDFFSRVVSQQYSPRSYVLENLTIAQSTKRMLDIFGAV